MGERRKGQIKEFLRRNKDIELYTATGLFVIADIAFLLNGQGWPLIISSLATAATAYAYTRTR